MNPYESPAEPQLAMESLPVSPGAIPFAGPLSQEQVAAAIRFAGFSNLRSRLVVMAIPVLFAVVMLLIMLMQRDGRYTDYTVWGTVFAILIVSIAWGQFRSAVSIAKQWRAAGTNLECQGEIAADHVTMSGPALTQIFRWIAFVGYRANEDQLILYVHFPTQFIYCIRSHFRSDGEWQKAIEIVSGQLKKC